MPAGICFWLMAVQLCYTFTMRYRRCFWLVIVLFVLVSCYVMPEQPYDIPTVENNANENKDDTLQYQEPQPETPDTTVVPEQPEEPDVPGEPEMTVLPEGENLLSNGDFEDWNGGTPVDWSVLHASNALIERCGDAKEGCSSVVVKGDASSKKRFISKSYVLEAGRYCFVVHVKADGDEAGYCRLGYVPVTDGEVSLTRYQYEGSAASAVSGVWLPRIYEFVLDKELEIAFVIMNHNFGNGASFLVDDARLIKK